MPQRHVIGTGDAPDDRLRQGGISTAITPPKIPPVKINGSPVSPAL
jgi:hypothetical protein